MHPTAEMKKEIAELRAEIEALKQSTAPNPTSAAAAADAEAAIVEQRGHAEAAAEGRRKHDLWLADQRRQTEAKEAAALAALYVDRDGNALPAGQWRDPSGRIRDKEGYPIEVVARAKAETEQVMRQQAIEHRSYLQRIGMRPSAEPFPTPATSTQGDLT